MKKVGPGIAVVGISLVLAVGFGRVMRPGTETESSAAITITVAATPDTLALSAKSASVSGRSAQLSSPMLDPAAANSHSPCEPSVCESTATVAQTGDAHRVPRNAIAIDASSGQLDPASIVDAVSSASPLGGAIDIRPQAVPKPL